MLNYVLVGSNQLEKAKVFYDSLLATISMNKLYDDPSGRRLYGSPVTSMFGVGTPLDKNPATIANGSTYGFFLDSAEKVAAFHAKAIELGATCDGPPGDRGGGAHFAYFRDLDGNKLCAYSVARKTA